MNQKERFERYKHLTGLNAWEISSYKNQDNKVVLNDGPSGLRKPLKLGFTEQQEVIKTVCMPTPSALAASFDKKSTYLSSELIAKECLYHKTDILLAPGINIKRYVLCGRNFEYFSEDPYLTGILAASYVNGLENNGVGACIKHYACNSQEHARTINSSEVSLRALNEIYLRAFKYTLEHSNPSSIMTSYNKINDEYVNESKYLMQDKLRNEYNYQGLIMSDWCAVSNKGLTFKTGLNIEMPITKMSNEMIDRDYNKLFTDEDLIKLDDELNNTLMKFKEKKTLGSLDLDILHEDAVNVANKTVILVKNDKQYLPIKKEDKVLVLGYFANHSRFVGGGSGWVNAYKPYTFLEVLDQHKTKYDFIECYDEEKLTISKDELLSYKGKYEKIVLLLGQYQFDESEGWDRSSINLRNQQLETLRLVKDVFDNFATVLVTGSVNNVEEVYSLSSSLMITYLAGEGQSEAIYNNIFGLHNPSGRLPETWISSLEQNPIIKEYLRRDVYHTYYYDDIYVGYRYYDLHNNGFMLPFGYGLSYSKFTYSNFEINKSSDEILISLDINNISDINGEEVIQVYIGKKESNVYRPLKELKGFEKIKIQANSKEKVEIKVLIKDLEVYRYSTDRFELEEGEYQVYVALNTKDIIYTSNIYLNGNIFEKELEPRKLKMKSVENKYTFDSAGGLLFENEYFKEYVRNNNLNIKLENFEKRYFYIDCKALRVLIGDGDFNITFEELEGLIKYLNQHPKEVDKKLNFDDQVKKYRGL